MKSRGSKMGFSQIVMQDEDRAALEAYQARHNLGHLALGKVVAHAVQAADPARTAREQREEEARREVRESLARIEAALGTRASVEGPPSQDKPSKPGRPAPPRLGEYIRQAQSKGPL